MAEKRVAFLVGALSVAVLFAMEMTLSVAAVPAIFIFGDSTVDVGNNNYLPDEESFAKANQAYNGIDFPGGVATGRFSNGYNTADFLAMLMGFEMSPAAFYYLVNSSTLTDQMSKGINFASGGSGIQDHTGDFLGGTFSLRAQIENFATVRSNLTVEMGSAATDVLLSKSLFLISTGNCDFFEYYFWYRAENSTRNEEFLTNITTQFKDHLQTLYQLGARKFGIIGIPPIGCCPFERFHDKDKDCSQDLNELSEKFHTATASILNELRYELQGMNYSLGNTYEMIITVFQDPLKYGYKDLTSACCQNGPFDAQSLCNPNSTYCSNRDEYLFWDPYHPTQNASNLAAQALYSGSTRFADPINFGQLVDDGN